MFWILSGPVQCPRHVSHIGHYPDTFEIYQRDGKVETLERSWTRRTKRDWVWGYFMCIVFLNEKRPPTASQDKETVSMYIHRKKMGWFWLLIGLIKNMSGNRGLEVSGCYFTSTARRCVMISSHDIPWKVTPVPSFIFRLWHHSKVCARRTDYDGDWSIHLKAGQCSDIRPTIDSGRWHLCWDDLLCKCGSGGFSRCRAIIVVANQSAGMQTVLLTMVLCQRWLRIWASSHISCPLLHVVVQWKSLVLRRVCPDKPSSHYGFSCFELFNAPIWASSQTCSDPVETSCGGPVATLHQLQRSKYYIDHNCKLIYCSLWWHQNACYHWNFCGCNVGSFPVRIQWEFQTSWWINSLNIFQRHWSSHAQTWTPILATTLGKTDLRLQTVSGCRSFNSVMWAVHCFTLDTSAWQAWSRVEAAGLRLTSLSVSFGFFLEILMDLTPKDGRFELENALLNMI